MPRKLRHKVNSGSPTMTLKLFIKRWIFSWILTLFVAQEMIFIKVTFWNIFCFCRFDNISNVIAFKLLCASIVIIVQFSFLYTFNICDTAIKRVTDNLIVTQSIIYSALVFLFHKSSFWSIVTAKTDTSRFAFRQCTQWKRAWVAWCSGRWILTTFAALAITCPTHWLTHRSRLLMTTLELTGNKSPMSASMFDVRWGKQLLISWLVAFFFFFIRSVFLLTFITTL